MLVWHWEVSLGKSVDVALGRVSGEEWYNAGFTEKLIAHFCMECSWSVRKQDLVLLAPCEKYLTEQLKGVMACPHSWFQG